jgi:hypothetical protein
MSANSDKYNALPIEIRTLICGLMIEAEIRVVELEKRRILQEAKKAMAAHSERIKRMREFLRSLEPSHGA